MDPTENLKEQLELATRIMTVADGDDYVDEADAARLAELVLALNEWIAKGGFLPAVWVKAPTEALELLRQGYRMMPLGTKKRADWMGRAGDCLIKAGLVGSEVTGG